MREIFVGMAHCAGPDFFYVFRTQTKLKKPLDYYAAKVEHVFLLRRRGAGGDFFIIKFGAWAAEKLVYSVDNFRADFKTTLVNCRAESGVNVGRNSAERNHFFDGFTLDVRNSGTPAAMNCADNAMHRILQQKRNAVSGGNRYGKAGLSRDITVSEDRQRNFMKWATVAFGGDMHVVSVYLLTKNDVLHGNIAGKKKSLPVFEDVFIRVIPVDAQIQ